MVSWSAVTGFDWADCDNQSQKGQKGGNRSDSPITADAMRFEFDNGNRWLSAADAVQGLIDLTGKKKSTCHNALQLKGKFGPNLLYDKKRKLFTWRP